MWYIGIMNQIEQKPTINPYQLPRLREYLLNLKNNNYSKETLDNYGRDLEIFSAFLFYIETPFEKIDKFTIIEFKGFLREQNYIPILHKYQDTHGLGELTQKEIDQSKTNISELKKAMYKGQLSDNSVNRMLSSLRSYLSFLVDMDIQVPVSPTAIKMIKAEKKEKQVAEFDELV
jgi:site-specific recombinase XerD